MKKKILLGLGILAIATVLFFNVSLVGNGNNYGLSLSSLGTVLQAQAEDPQPLYGYEDQYCKSGSIGCCIDAGCTCETGIKCTSGGC